MVHLVAMELLLYMAYLFVLVLTCSLVYFGDMVLLSSLVHLR